MDSELDLTVTPRRDAQAVRAETSWKQLLYQFSPMDLISGAGHSPDFNGSRAEYINSRVRLLALIFAVLTPLWIPVDYVVLGGDAVMPILVMRVISALGLLALGLTQAPRHNLNHAYFRLAAFIGILDLFYIGARTVLGGGIPEGALIGYTFIPFLIVALLAIFPLSVLEGLFLSGVVIISMLGVEVFFGTLLTLQTLSDFWLLGLITAIAIWAEVSQLHMLLSLYRQATRDSLTGLVNRRALMNRLDDETDRATRYGRPFSVLLFDLDRFKRINDTYGHLTGDAVLKVFSDVLVKTLRSSDLIGRYGGEEFIAVLPESNQASAAEVAERIRIACQTATACGPTKCVAGFTASIGVAQLKQQESTEQLLNRVDQALYTAKEGGRNQVVIAE